MIRTLLLAALLLSLCSRPAFSQAQEELKNLIRERKTLFDEYNAVYKKNAESKNKKLNAEVISSASKLIEKDAAVIDQIVELQSQMQKLSAQLSSKENSSPKPGKQNSIRENALLLYADSLSRFADVLLKEKDSLSRTLVHADQSKSILATELNMEKENASGMQKKLEASQKEIDRLELRNDVLLVFNVAIAVLLVAGLIYVMFRRRRNPASVHPDEATVKELKRPVSISGFNQQAMRAHTDPLEMKMEKIEKLGKLREKGLLTDEEFISQKEKILNA